MISKKTGLLVILQTLGASFARIFRYFAQIFNKSKLLGVRLYPLRPPPTPLCQEVANWRIFMTSLTFLSLVQNAVLQTPPKKTFIFR